MGGMTASTLQVQLCEYRQFRHAIARSKYGLPDDETMRCAPETHARFDPVDCMQRDKKKNCLNFSFPIEDEKVEFVVSLAQAKSEQVAIRVATIAYSMLRDGRSKQ